MIFDRIKPLDAILANAERKGLKRELGAFQLVMLGIGAIIGTGIFVLTAEAAQKAGPGMMASFVIAGFVCGVPHCVMRNWRRWCRYRAPPTRTRMQCSVKPWRGWWVGH